LKSTLLPQVAVKGNTRNMLASLGLGLRQHCQFLAVTFFVKDNVLGPDINTNKGDGYQ
jgi:hypothetical protein